MTAISESEAAWLEGSRGPQLRRREIAPQRRGATPGASPLGVAEVDHGGRVLIFTFFEELAEPVKKLAFTAWAARGKLARDVKAYVLLVTGMVCSMPGRVSKVVNNPRLHELIAQEEDPQALAAVLCGASGALCLGSCGAVIGAAVGGATGLALGAVPAIFTFGLSLPVGAVLGGGVGLAVGSTVGGSAGLAGGATSGMTVAYFRDEIMYAVLQTASRVYDAYDFVVVKPVTVVRNTGRRVTSSVHSGADYTRAKAHAVGHATAELAGNPRVRVAAAGAGVGAAACGTAGAASGAMVGGTVGALVGLVPALFTFGLSIPIGAVVGGGAGLCVGGAAGTTAGFAGGGFAGLVGYTYRWAPAAAYNFAADKAHAAAVAVHLKNGAKPA